MYTTAAWSIIAVGEGNVALARVKGRADLSYWRRSYEVRTKGEKVMGGGAGAFSSVIVDTVNYRGIWFHGMKMPESWEVCIRALIANRVIGAVICIHITRWNGLHLVAPCVMIISHRYIYRWNWNLIVDSPSWWLDHYRYVLHEGIHKFYCKLNI